MFSRIFSVLACVLLGVPQQYSIPTSTGANRNAAPTCTVPTVNSRWAAFSTLNDCGGTCVNGSAANTMADLGSGGMTATATSASGFAKAVYTTNVINGLPAFLFTPSNNDAFAVAGFPNTGSMTIYMVLNTNNGGAASDDLVSPNVGNGFEWYIGSNVVHVNLRQFSVVATGGSVSNSVWVTQAVTINFSSNAIVLYSCSGGTCSSTGTGTWTNGTQVSANTIGGGNGWYGGYIAELGYRNSITSMADIGAYSQCMYSI